MDQSEDSINFEKLPVHVIENILSYLPYTELPRISQLNELCYELSNKLVRKGFHKLYNYCYSQLDTLRSQIEQLPSTYENLGRRMKLLRSYFTLEAVVSELKLVRSISHRIIDCRTHNILSIAEVVEECFSVYFKAKECNFPPWQFSSDPVNNVQKLTKVFLDEKFPQMNWDELFGCIMVDIINSFIMKSYYISVKYRPDVNECSIDAVIKIENPQYLSRPPRFANEANGNGPSRQDKKRLINYFVSLVRINNRVTLREEQYIRETEASNRSNDAEINDGLFFGGTRLEQSVRVHSKVLPNPRREIRRQEDRNVIEIEETYNLDSIEAATADKSLLCGLELHCPLKAAPLCIWDCWIRIKREIMTGKIKGPLWEEISDSLSAMDLLAQSLCQCDIDESPPEDSNFYQFTCSTEVSIPINNVLETSELTFTDR